MEKEKQIGIKTLVPILKNLSMDKLELIDLNDFINFNKLNLSSKITLRCRFIEILNNYVNNNKQDEAHMMVKFIYILKLFDFIQYNNIQYSNAFFILIKNHLNNSKKKESYPKIIKSINVAKCSAMLNDIDYSIIKLTEFCEQLLTLDYTFDKFIFHFKLFTFLFNIERSFEWKYNIFNSIRDEEHLYEFIESL